MSTGTDQLLRRFERDGLVAGAALTVVAFAITRRADVALGVVGGTALMALSYNALKGAVDAILRGLPATQAPGGRAEAGGGEATAGGRRQEAEGGEPMREAGAREDRGETLDEGRQAIDVPPPALSRGRRVLAAVKFFTRYALLAVGAYVMLTRFRLHPAGLLAGATTPFLAAVAQVVRLSRAGKPTGTHPF